MNSFLFLNHVHLGSYFLKPSQLLNEFDSCCYIILILPLYILKLKTEKLKICIIQDFKQFILLTLAFLKPGVLGSAVVSVLFVVEVAFSITLHN